MKDFEKVEPCLTFIDFNQLEAATLDVRTKLGALEYENLKLKGQIAELLPLKEQIADIHKALEKAYMEVKPNKSVGFEEWIENMDETTR